MVENSRERDRSQPQRIFDTHVHFPWGEERDPVEATEELVEVCRRHNVVKVALLGSRWADYNERVAGAIEQHSELFVGMYGVELGEDRHQLVAVLHRRGGLPGQ